MRRTINVEIGEMDDSILKKLRNNRADQQIYFDKIYRRHFPLIRSYILRNHGNQEDAQDVFQEVLLVLLQKIDDPQFKLTVSPGTLIYAIARNIWRSRLKRSGKLKMVDISDFLYEVIDDPAEESLQEKEGQLSRWIGDITHRCQQIINSLFFLREPMDALAVRMGWKNRHSADNQKYKCIQQLRKVAEK